MDAFGDKCLRGIMSYRWCDVLNQRLSPARESRLISCWVRERQHLLYGQFSKFFPAVRDVCVTDSPEWGGSGGTSTIWWIMLGVLGKGRGLRRDFLDSGDDVWGLARQLDSSNWLMLAQKLAKRRLCRLFDAGRRKCYLWNETLKRYKEAATYSHSHS